ncbi:hypothetical protein OG21DRAFT_923223 [Imleria badia]|nr:hypothetical protein OG21DRAFT_923223 [Imleria badia]
MDRLGRATRPRGSGNGASEKNCLDAASLQPSVPSFATVTSYSPRIPNSEQSLHIIHMRSMLRLLNLLIQRALG